MGAGVIFENNKCLLTPFSAPFSWKSARDFRDFGGISGTGFRGQQDLDFGDRDFTGISRDFQGFRGHRDFHGISPGFPGISGISGTGYQIPMASARPPHNKSPPFPPETPHPIHMARPLAPFHFCDRLSNPHCFGPAILEQKPPTPPETPHPIHMARPLAPCPLNPPAEQ